MSAKGQEKASLSPAVSSAVEVLIVLSEEGSSLPAAAIARRISRAKSTAANILAALHEARLVERDERGRYGLGRKVVELGGPRLAESDWISDFHRMCLELPTAQFETVSLASLHDDEIIYLAHHDGTQPVRWVSNVGAHLPAAATALGVTMLSTLSPDALDKALVTITDYPQMTEFSYGSEAELREAIDLSREQGFAVGDQLNTMGLCSISRPLSHGKSRVYGVGVTLMSLRVTPELQEQLLEDLDHLARRLVPPISAS